MILHRLFFILCALCGSPVTIGLIDISVGIMLLDFSKAFEIVPLSLIFFPHNLVLFLVILVLSISKCMLIFLKNHVHWIRT